jgi:hypothetical protein
MTRNSTHYFVGVGYSLRFDGPRSNRTPRGVGVGSGSNWQITLPQ